MDVLFGIGIMSLLMTSISINLLRENKKGLFEFSKFENIMLGVVTAIFGAITLCCLIGILMG